MSGMKASALGRVTNMRSEPGGHMFAYGCEVVEDEAFMTAGVDGPIPADMKDWLWNLYHQIPEDAVVRVTVEVVA